MTRYVKLFFILILLFSVYHLIRDLLQTFHYDNVATDLLHWHHDWCGKYCDVVTYPLDLINLIGSIIVLKSNKVGIIGIIVLATIPLWILALLVP